MQPLTVPQVNVPAGMQVTMAEGLPQCTAAMLIVAQLLHKTSYRLAKHLNAVLRPYGLQEVCTIQEALFRARNRFLPAAEVEALEQCLDRFFLDIAGPGAQACRKQWPKVVDWSGICDEMGYSTQVIAQYAQATKWLKQAHALVQQDAEFQPVREAALAMIEFLAEGWEVSI